KCCEVVAGALDGERPQGERVIGGQVNGVTGARSRQSDPSTGDNWPAHCPQAVRWTAASGAPVTPRAKI
ncbi:hypothetical protein ACW5XG_20835, partial [Aeromonas veronii]